MTISVFHIDGSDYTAYASVAEADKLLRPDPRWAKWDALQEEQKQINLVLASRLIDDAGRYSGMKVQANQALQFPRNGIKCNDADITETLPIEIVNAAIYLAGTIANNPSVVSVDRQNQTGNQAQIKKVVAEPVEIEYFEKASAGDGSTGTQVPDASADALIRCFFEGATLTVGAGLQAFGTGSKSEFTDPNKFDTW